MTGCAEPPAGAASFAATAGSARGAATGDGDHSVSAADEQAATVAAASTALAGRPDEGTTSAGVSTTAGADDDAPDTDLGRLRTTEGFAAALAARNLHKRQRVCSLKPPAAPHRAQRTQQHETRAARRSSSCHRRAPPLVMLEASHLLRPRAPEPRPPSPSAATQMTTASAHQLLLRPRRPPRARVVEPQDPPRPVAHLWLNPGVRVAWPRLVCLQPRCGSRVVRRQQEQPRVYPQQAPPPGAYSCCYQRRLRRRRSRAQRPLHRHLSATPHPNHRARGAWRHRARVHIGPAPPPAAAARATRHRRHR